MWANHEAVGRYVKTPILSQRSLDAMTESGYGFAEIEDVASAMMRLVTDPNVNGKPPCIQSGPLGLCDGVPEKGRIADMMHARTKPFRYSAPSRAWRNHYRQRIG